MVFMKCVVVEAPTEAKAAMFAATWTEMTGSKKRYVDIQDEEKSLKNFPKEECPKRGKKRKLEETEREREETGRQRKGR